MSSVLLLVYLFHSLGLVAPLPVHHIATTFEHLERDLAKCECPSEQRTVWAIVWSCLATVFTCTWVSVHPNIPGPDDSEWKVAKRRAGLMMWAILAPELVIFWAIRQWAGARQLADKFHQFNWTKTHGYFLQIGGFTLYESETPKRVLSGRALERLFKEGKIVFPTITEAEIQDHSKGDGFTKAIAIFQTTWFVAQCIARHVQGLVITELEIITLAFATLNGIMYFFWWNKPLAVRYSTPVFLLQEPRAKQALEKSKPPVSFWNQISKPVRRQCVSCCQSGIRKLSTLKHGKFHWSWRAILAFPWNILERGVIDPVGEFCGDDRFHVNLDSRTYTRYAEVISTKTFHYYAAITVIAIGNLFGAIHCIAWSSPFPSEAERALWRTCSLILLVMPELVFLVSEVVDLELDRLSKPLKWVVKGPSVLLAGFVVAVGIPSYAMARLALIIEAFITLRALTPAALVEVEWTSFIPHI